MAKTRLAMSFVACVVVVVVIGVFDDRKVGRDVCECGGLERQR